MSCLSSRKHLFQLALIHRTLSHCFCFRFSPCQNKTNKQNLDTIDTLRERPFHYLGGGGLEELFSADYFFTWCLKLDFFFTHQLKPDFFFHKELKVRLFFYSHVSSQRYSHYFQGWGKIIFFATYQSKKFFSTYRLGQIIFFRQKQRQIIFSKTLPAPPQIMKWSLPYPWTGM